ncbi:helix-turn-helix domain-containing protein [Streptomyces sp. NPDC001414]
MAVRIIDCTEPAELYRHYEGEFEPQGAYIELDLREGSLLADYNSEVGNAVPEAVCHGFEIRFSIPVLTADAANRVMRELAPLAERMLADWEEEWNGNNHVARLGGDAQAAYTEIEQHLGCDAYGDDTQGFDGSDLVTVWDVDGATNGCEADEYDITADTTDARLDEIEVEILKELADVSESTVVVAHGLDGYLKSLRDGLADEDPLTAAEFRIAREYLGLSGDHLAKLLGVNPRTLRSWEQGRDDIPGRFRPEIAALKASTLQAVTDMVTAFNEGEGKALLTYRSDEEFEAARKAGAHQHRDRSASWHRQVTARAAEQCYARVDYAEETNEDE